MTFKTAMSKDSLIITCEHGGNDVPPDYATLFAQHEELLQTHRGWDPGALKLAQEMAAAFEVPLIASTTTRLLIDLNRSIGNRTLLSEVTRPLPRSAQRHIENLHYRPHRNAVESEVARHIDAGRRVVHVASHSFAPELNGIARPDVAWLYDSRRSDERAFSGLWMAALRERRPDLKLRRNYPYEGKLDGLTSQLRKRYPQESYIGMEIEINQRYPAGDELVWRLLYSDVIAALGDLMQREVATRQQACSGTGGLAAG